MEYAFILIVVFILTPFVLKLSAKQDLKSKTTLKTIFLMLLTFQILSGFFNWENFSVGRSGFDLSLAYPDSFLGLFFIISLLQIILLHNKSFNTLVANLNFINSVFIFTGMIRISNSLGYQTFSFASVSAVFLVLFGNIITLAYINKDKNLLKKYLRP